MYVTERVVKAILFEFCSFSIRELTFHDWNLHVRADANVFLE